MKHYIVSVIIFQELLDDIEVPSIRTVVSQIPLAIEQDEELLVLAGS